MTNAGFERAVRRAVRPLIALAGPSGSGKTLSALLMARGIVGHDGKLAVLDTENRRSEMYADNEQVGGFFIKHMHQPFTSQSFQEAIDQAERAGMDAIVIDSMSHEWNGMGGCVEMAEEIQIKTKKEGPFVWIKPKRAHLRMMNRIGQTQIPIIFCLRTKPQLVSEKDANGRQTFSKGPEVAEQESRFIYEMTLAALLEHDTHKANYSQLKSLPLPLQDVLRDGERIGVETGAAIRAWVEGGAAIDKEYEHHATVLRDLSAIGLEAMQRHWKTIPIPMQKRLEDVKEECKAIAQRAEELAAASEPEQTSGQRGIALLPEGEDAKEPQFD